MRKKMPLSCPNESTRVRYVILFPVISLPSVCLHSPKYITLLKFEKKIAIKYRKQTTVNWTSCCDCGRVGDCQAKMSNLVQVEKPASGAKVTSLARRDPSNRDLSQRPVRKRYKSARKTQASPKRASRVATRRIFASLEESLSADVDDVLADGPASPGGVLRSLASVFRTTIGEAAGRLGRLADADGGGARDALATLDRYLAGMLETWRSRDELSDADANVLKSTVRSAAHCLSSWYDARARGTEEEEEEEEGEARRGGGLPVEFEPLPPTNSSSGEEQDVTDLVLPTPRMKPRRRRRGRKAAAPSRAAVDAQEELSVQMQTMSVAKPAGTPAARSSRNDCQESVADVFSNPGGGVSPHYEDGLTVRRSPVDLFPPSFGFESVQERQRGPGRELGAAPTLLPGTTGGRPADLGSSIRKLELERLERSRATQEQMARETELLQRVNSAEFPPKLLQLKISESLEIGRDILEQAHAKIEALFVLARLQEDMRQSPRDAVAAGLQQVATDRHLSSAERTLECLKVALISINANLPC